MKRDRPSAHAHLLIRETAVAMAHELYDTLMRDDHWYSYWKGQHPEATAKQLEARFVARNLSKLLPQARATLAGMLRTTTDETLKEQIAEALILDNTLLRGRAQ